MDYLILIAGLVLLLVGGEMLVKGAVGISLKWKVAPMIIGLTVVSFGTSAPELLVSLGAALSGHADIAIGNVVGSNIANLALVLGATAIVINIPVEKMTINFDWPVMMGSSLLLWFFIKDGVLQYWEGIILIAVLVTYLVTLITKVRLEKRRNKDVVEEAVLEEPEKDKSYLFYFGFLILGILGLIFGAKLMVSSATVIAKSLGVSEYIIGVTVFAFGTSLPELATSIIAARKGQTDISVGNLIGSNIFNILAVLGITSTVQEININNQVLSSDIYWMLGVSLLVFPMMIFKRNIGKISGVLLLLVYILYIYLVIPK